MPDRPSPIRPWEAVEAAIKYDCRLFSIRERRARSPRTGELHDFWVIESCDWVNVIPITPDGDVVMVRQYRHGISESTLEVPGGMVDPEDESPLEAARRELQEETGYASDEVTPLGWIHPNPATQNNRCYTFLARGAERRYDVRFEGTEETEVVLVPLAEIPELIQNGRISHALVVVAFHRLLLAEGDVRSLWSGARGKS
ncbi:MAG: ADP-ribose pyrophosphatase [Candidatus Binatota bacterium]|nr:ADP-ribose pyrophosphatase [Candidatus Binatota bacterium]